jgi:nucleoside-diphosphate-sugar epimerase
MTKTIVITGGLGNLGSKLCHHLLSNEDSSSAPPTTSYKIILLEHPSFINKPPPHPSATVIPCNLQDASSSAKVLEKVLPGVDTVVHFSAVNPYPNATWGESAESEWFVYVGLVWFRLLMLAVKAEVVK